MTDKNSVYGKRKFSIERAQQAMKLRGMSRLETARRIGRLNGGYEENSDDKGCYKALSKALADGFMSDKMLEKFCKEVNVDPYVIRGDADKDLYELYKINCIICDCGSFEDYQKNLDLDLYPNKGNFRKINDSYEPNILADTDLIKTYNQLMYYFGVMWIDTQSNGDETEVKTHSEEYYTLMDNVLTAVCNCIKEFVKKPQKAMVCPPETADSFINYFRTELYYAGIIDATSEEN